MIAYGIKILYLIRDLREAYPEVIQLFYTIKLESKGKFGHVKYHLEDLMNKGLLRGHLPDLNNNTRKLLQVQEQLNEMGLRVVQEIWSLGFPLGYVSRQTNCMG